MQKKIILLLTLLIGFVAKAQLDTVSKKSNRHQIIGGTDNDFFAVLTNKDRSYSFGVFAGYRVIPKKENILTQFFKQKEEAIHFINVNLEAYTPNYNFETGETTGVRPFAGWTYLTLGTSYVFNKSILSFKTDIGVLGEISQAHATQDWFHKNVTGDVVLKGWDKQVPNQLGINLKANYTRSVYTSGLFNGFVTGETSIGNVRTYIYPQVGLRFGNFLDLQKSVGFNTSLLNREDKIEYYIKLTGGFKLKAYDATLQGNLFGSNNPNYMLDEIDNSTFHGSLGGYFHYKSFDFSAIYYINSGEIDAIKTHSYGSIIVAYQF